jgi:tRNA (cmo5U34)-methyltransferase
MHNQSSPYANTSVIASYAQDAPRKVPGLADLHRMAMLLLTETAPSDAQILVVGAGGGLETRGLAEMQPGWRFTGVDPSAPMLDLASRTVAPFADRVHLIVGTVDQAPDELFDGATCILTLHHLDHDTRLHTLQQIRRRLKPGARLVIAGHSAPGSDPERWMTRSTAFGDRAEINWDRSRATARMMTERLPLLTPLQEEKVLQEAGFSDIELFYAAFTFRGWVATS